MVIIRWRFCLNLCSIQCTYSIKTLVRKVINTPRPTTKWKCQRKSQYYENLEWNREYTYHCTTLRFCSNCWHSSIYTYLRIIASSKNQVLKLWIRILFIGFCWSYGLFWPTTECKMYCTIWLKGLLPFLNMLFRGETIT